MDDLKKKPSSNEEWTIHALNIHGAFFEKKCVELIKSVPGYKIISKNYPVEFPKPINGIRGKESSLDIYVQSVPQQDLIITIPVECKKNNPDYVDWIFFPSTEPKSANPYITKLIDFEKKESWQLKPRFTKMFVDKFVIADESRETKGNYQKQMNQATKTKTANNSISDAAYQVSLASQSIFQNELEHETDKLKKNDNENVYLRTNRNMVIPIIVTTANLFVCNFDVNDIETLTGEINFNKANLESVPYLIYKYPLPSHLQYLPEGMLSDNLFRVDDITKTHILVVNSEHLTELLQKLPKLIYDYWY